MKRGKSITASFLLDRTLHPKRRLPLYMEQKYTLEQMVFGARLLATEQTFDTLIAGFEKAKQAPDAPSSFSMDEIIELLKLSREKAVSSLTARATVSA